MGLINSIKLTYWRWVRTSCEDDIRDISGTVDLLCVDAKAFALNELNDLHLELDFSKKRIKELGG